MSITGDDWHRRIVEDDEPTSCPDCGHPEDGHDRRAEDNKCFRCNDAAEFGIYAPCAFTGPAYTYGPLPEGGAE